MPCRLREAEPVRVREPCVATCADTRSLNDANDCKVRPPLGRRMFMPHVVGRGCAGGGGVRRG